LGSDYCSKEILYALKKRKPILALHLDSTGLPDKIELMLGDIQRLSLPDYGDLPACLAAVDAGLQRIEIV
jgi:hypothetical protein